MSSTLRAANELRPVRFDLDYVIYPEGSVLISAGNTRVLCNATVLESLPRWLQRSKNRHGWVTAEYAMLPRSTSTRTSREVMQPKGRSQEIKRLIGRSLRAGIDLARLGERQIIVDCDVLQADGGTRTASVTGGYVALALAIYRLRQQGKLQEDPVVRKIAAVSVGMVGGVATLDLNYEQDLAADVDLNVVMTGRGDFVEVQGTAEGDPFSAEALNEMLALARSGIAQLIEGQQSALKSAGFNDY